MNRALSVLCLVGCGSPTTVPDAAAAGPCGDKLSFQGELVDWDSTDAQFCGIFGANVQVHGDPSTAKATPPNGRIEMCVAQAPTTLIDVTPPTDASQCANPSSTYDIPGVIVADQAVLASGALASARAFTIARAPAFAYDATKAQLFVHVDGTPSAVSITGTHDASQVFDGATWAPGSTGANVFVPNVDPTAGTTDVSLADGGLGTGSVPIAAGTFTYVTLVAH